MAYIQNLENLTRHYDDLHKKDPNNGNYFAKAMLEREIQIVKSTPNPFAIYLKLCGNNVQYTKYRYRDEDMLILCRALTVFPCITMLDLRYNEISDDGARIIAEYLKKAFTLQELNLMGNDIKKAGAREIAGALVENKTLLILKLAGNKIGCRGGLCLAQALQINGSVQYIDLGECDLAINSVIAFATILKRNRTLVGVNLNRPLLWTLQEEPTVHMGEMLCSNDTLKELHLAKFDLRDFGACRLSDAMTRNKSLEILNISSNRIARDGARALSCVLQANCSLTVLDLACNRIQCEGAKLLAQALANGNDNLRVLVISYNEIEGKGLCAMARTLANFNSTLRRIYIWGNKLDEDTCNAFYGLLASGRLDEDSTDVRPYSVDGRTYLAMLNHECDYRRYRFSVPFGGTKGPKDRSLALY